MPAVASTPQGDPMATEEVMKGRMALADPEGTELDSAAAHFTRAVLQDSAFAPGWIGLAQVHFARGLAGSDTDAGELEAAAQIASRALQLEPSSREAQEILVHIGAVQGGGDPGTVNRGPAVPPPARVRGPTGRWTPRARLPAPTGSPPSPRPGGRRR